MSTPAVVTLDYLWNVCAWQCHSAEVPITISMEYRIVQDMVFVDTFYIHVICACMWVSCFKPALIPN